MFFGALVDILDALVNRVTRVRAFDRSGWVGLVCRLGHFLCDGGHMSVWLDQAVALNLPVDNDFGMVLGDGVSAADPIDAGVMLLAGFPQVGKPKVSETRLDELSVVDSRPGWLARCWALRI